MSEATLEARDLSKYFPASNNFIGKKTYVHAVEDVSFTLSPGRITALVGGSGAAKSTVARMLVRLYEPTSGTITLDGVEGGNARRYRSQVQMIFQDPFGSLNPAKTIRHHIARPLEIHGIVPPNGVDDRVHELLRTVGLTPPE